MKKIKGIQCIIICILIVPLLLFSSLYSASASFTYQNEPRPLDTYLDIQKDKWFFPALTFCWEMQIFDYAKNTEYFGPNDTITRGDIIKSIGKYAEYANLTNIDQYEESTFLDLEISEEKYFAWAESIRIIHGDGNGYFYHNKPITREQMAVILYNLKIYLNFPNTNKLDFRDINLVSNWAKDAVTVLGGDGIINGYTNGSFRPKQEITKVEAAQVLYNFIQYFNMNQ